MPPGGFRAVDEGSDLAAEGRDFAFHADLDDVIASAIHDAQGDPKSLKEAQLRKDWPRWKEAMDREMDTLQHAGTWTAVS